ncbi:MAG: hypothetical protein A3C50_00730 [Candidatus Staskawiczbacteria bacterium RIFCSPHIGHO2_02_FULL_43_16]|uniref:Small ribosomal subunit protein uS4 n=1 Tax=Candidatus Staskawiczbacteria bacterium RIFCSPHIGHO2_01_FULL_41_41 TaxID=1802203 RepID=A0A1G2HTW2_9BACT|nr:MAG: hypothetical protein A2822_00160 [Candidatus Staskawiczbacteria bacterium RIFCSPHIGHO2_01_FULL_41_41]OGZ68281.1 MAG: hypothetical protein A3C50_00730 [Candidatus Staskawiczbacteria bacterium RIFCSPHIGHO2_02_FULL_43_16]OGZ74670.1 MAG: hypothetical protein A3A12_00825 [Candidatus Staskawiczbacteria bacterium RIFCSPLOWO2_01_FULL_43_17b]
MAEPFVKKPSSGKGSNDPFSPTGAPEKRKKREGAVSEYKKSLKEKQALKRLYGLSEKQFKKYVLNALDKMARVENVSDELIKNLEKRLDNVVFRLGYAKTRAMSRQLVSHAYFLINGKPVNIPSYKMSKGDVITIKESKKKKAMFTALTAMEKKPEPHAWLTLNKTNFEGKAIGEPSLAEVSPPVEISLIFEFYSR